MIPIQNLYYLLVYAWDTLDEAGQIDVDVAGSTDLLDLFARVLDEGVKHVLRRGLARAYVTHSAELAGIRGRLSLSESLSRLSFVQGRAHCEFDDLSPDVLHNQILLATLVRLIRHAGLDRELRASLQFTSERLGRLSSVSLNEGTFRRIQLHRNIGFYRFLLEICRLVALQILPEEAPGRYQFRDFLRDEKAMALLFQRFVRNFYAHEQSKYRVSSVRLNWQATVGSPESLELLPVMETDVSLTRDGEHLVIDTKYYREALRSRYGKDRLRSEHLYQLFSYLRNISMAPGAPGTVEGLLLYPAVESELELEYAMHGHRVRVATVNLDREWREIRRQLLSRIGAHAPAA
jgi:5-methylcytosine-specific restriction enzyme subunit McrC